MKTTRYGGARDQAARAALAPLVLSGRAVCWRCGQPIAPTDDWDAGHTHDLALGGAPGGPVVPEHSTCNRRAGAILGQQLPTRRRRAARLRSWLSRSSFLRTERPEQPQHAPFLSPQNRKTQRTTRVRISSPAYAGRTP